MTFSRCYRAAISLAVPMRKPLWVAGLVLAVSAAVGGQTGPAVPSFTEPAFSPDRSEIAFASGGDIWAVPAQGGNAHLLVSHPATESRPLYAPDGRSLAFTSTRDGNPEIYVLTLATGEARRLTFDDGTEQLDAWSPDGRWLYYSSTSRDIAGMSDIYRVSASGGTPMPVSADRYVSEYFSAPSPDGRALAMTARGTVLGQWWRKGHSHLDESEVWVMRDGTPARYEAITSGGAKDLWPMWSADSRRLYFVSDRNGTQNLWVKSLEGQDAKAVTAFKNGRVLWPAISYDGKSIVFEHDFEIWTLDLASERAARVPISRRGTPAGPSVEHRVLTEQFQELALSPDTRKLAVVVLGEVFAAANTGGDAVRVTRTPANEFQITWSPDSRRLVYGSERDAVSHLFQYDFSSNTETQLTTGSKSEHSPRFSPDGKSLAFIRGDSDLHVLNLESRQETKIATGIFPRLPLGGPPAIAWSPDNRWIAYSTSGANLFRNIRIAAADGSNDQPVSFLANGFGNSLSWSPDGTSLLFDTGQRTEPRQIARIDLVPRTPRFTEDQFFDLFRDDARRGGADARGRTEPGGAHEPVKTEISFDGIRQRLSLIPVGVDATAQKISPDGRTLLLVAVAAGQQNIYAYPIDPLTRGPAVARQLTSTPGGKSHAQFSADGREVYYLEQGRVNALTVETRLSRRITMTAELDVDFNQLKMAVFAQGWSYLHDNFFDPEFNGVDWKAVRASYEPRIAGAATADETRRLMSLMVGELNASHLGVNAPAGTASATTGKLGLRFSRAEYEDSGSLTVREVVPLGPSAVAGLVAGDRVLAVDGVPVGRDTNLDQLLNHKTGDRVVLAVAPAAGGARRDVAVRPISTANEKNLLYRGWVEANRSYVARASGGRLGYVHIFDMSEDALHQLNVDLDVENQGRDGVVVDVRNNNGGFVNVYAIDVFARRNYLTMTPRGRVPAGARSYLGQRALGLPTILVTNQHTLSDAEDFTEGYRTLNLGKVVGEPTAGWIIFTSNVPLVDGTVFRLPNSKVFASDGSPMELHPRPVDIAVKRPIGEGLAAKDSQLDAAVAELLKQLGPGRR